MTIDSLKIICDTEVVPANFITKIDSIDLNLNLLVKEFNEFIKPKLISLPDTNPIQKLHHLILSDKESELFEKLSYTKTVIDLVRNIFNFKDVTYRSLQPNRAYSWHQDPGGMCIHIPLLTNPGCRFVYEDINFYMAANGSAYNVYNKDFHTFVNAGPVPRVHLMFENL
jgi:hypothetical protein